MSKQEENKLPKKVAGIRLPKLLRKSDLIETLMARPEGRKLLADAVQAAAAAVADVILSYDPGPTSQAEVEEISSSTGPDPVGKSKRRRRDATKRAPDTSDSADAPSGTSAPDARAKRKRRTRSKPSDTDAD